MKLLLLTLLFAPCGLAVSAQVPKSIPPIEPGVSHDLAAWRAANYSDIRYKLSLTLEKMSPVLKGTIEIRVNVGTRTLLSATPASAGGQFAYQHTPPIILDWRKINGNEKDFTISSVSLNGKPVSISTNWPPTNAGGSDFSEHLIFHDGVVAGDNVIKLDFTSPILTSGSGVTRYIDKGSSEYISSHFMPGNVSTPFPSFDQPDLKARFALSVRTDGRLWDSEVTSNEESAGYEVYGGAFESGTQKPSIVHKFKETKPISIYDFHFKAGPR